MDVLGVNHVKSPKQSKRSRSRGVKVVYISSPMKVKTSASKFRALVQELTGRDSDAERYLEINSGARDQSVQEFSHEQQLNGTVSHVHVHELPQLPFSSSFYEFPNCSDSVFEPFAGHFEFDVVRSFDQI